MISWIFGELFLSHKLVLVILLAPREYWDFIANIYNALPNSLEITHTFNRPFVMEGSVEWLCSKVLSNTLSFSLQICIWTGCYGGLNYFNTLLLGTGHSLLTGSQNIWRAPRCLKNITRVVLGSRVQCAGITHIHILLHLFTSERIQCE